jgi:hypothetical protein
MQQTREEIANLVKKSAETREKAAEVYSRLSRLMAYVERILWKKPLAATPARGSSYKFDIQP